MNTDGHNVFNEACVAKVSAELTDRVKKALEARYSGIKLTKRAALDCALSEWLSTQTEETKPNGLTKQHVAHFGELVQLRKENQDLIDYAWEFYREDWKELLECAHCVSDRYTTTEANKRRLRELVDREQRALDGLRLLIS